MVQVIAWVDQTSARHHEPRVFLPLSQVIGVFEFHVGGRVQDVPRLPVHGQHDLGQGLGGRPGAFHHTDPPGACFAQKVHCGSGHPGMRPESILHLRRAQPLPPNADEVHFHGYCLTLYHPAQATQLIEHLLHGGNQFGTIGFALCHADPRRRRGRGQAPCGPRQQGPGAGSRQPFSPGQVRFHCSLPGLLFRHLDGAIYGYARHRQLRPAHFLEYKLKLRGRGDFRTHQTG